MRSIKASDVRYFNKRLGIEMGRKEEDDEGEFKKPLT
jgi:hypothetical protein